METIGIGNAEDLQEKDTIKNVEAARIMKMINKALKNTKKLTKILILNQGNLE